MFAKNATDKFKDVFDSLFKSDENEKRSNALNTPPLKILNTEPKNVPEKTKTVQLVVEVQGAKPGASLVADDREIWSGKTAEDRIRAEISTANPAAGSKVKLVLRNPGPGARSAEYEVPVVT